MSKKEPMWSEIDGLVTVVADNDEGQATIRMTNPVGAVTERGYSTATPGRRLPRSLVQGVTGWGWLTGSST